MKDRMLAAIQRKIDGGEVPAAPEKKGGEVIDLMAALKASLQLDVDLGEGVRIEAIPVEAARSLDVDTEVA